MGCHYCDSWAGRPLGEKVLCEDCYQTVKSIPEDDRIGYLTERLQKIHGMLIKQPQQGYVGHWVKELASRLEYLSRLSVDPEATVAGRTVAAAPGLGATYGSQQQAVKLPKPMKIRKIR